MPDPAFLVPRRQLLAGTAAAATLGIFGGALAAADGAAANVTAAGGAGAGGTAANQGDDFDALRTRWRDDALTGGNTVDPNDPGFAAAIARLDSGTTSYVGRIDRTPARTRVFTDYPFSADANVSGTYQRLATMATAWATPGSRWQGDAGLLADILAGLETTNALVYYAGKVEFGNWWSWEIGATKALADTMVLVYDQLPADARDRYCAAIDHFVPDPYYMFPPERGRILSTGANRVDLCQAIAVRGIVGKDAEKVVRARDGLGDVWAYVTSGDGFYRDGSFVQHTYVPYTGTYGQVLLGGIGKLLALFAGSPYAVNDPNRQILFDSVEKTYAPVMYDALIMDFVRGRAVSRSNESDHADGYIAIEAILRLANGVSADLATRWRALCAGWLARDTYGNMLDGASVPRVALVKELAAAGVSPAPEPVDHRLFGDMDRAVHRRPGWAYAISMASRRIAYYESGNGENEKGFHSGSGMTYLYDGDNGQYADQFWPTVDLYRLPGTTVDAQRLPNKAGGEWGAARPPTATWAGGAVIDGRYAAVGQDLEGPLSPMRAKKSWFCLDEYVIALGAGISGSSGHPVETVVENRNLHATGENPLVVDGAVRLHELGAAGGLDRARWAHLDGVGGYLFPGGATVKGLREARTGSWRDVNVGGSTAAITRRYLTLWFDHGVDPHDASYAYVLVPGASPERTAELSEDPGFHILANTAKAQAVRLPSLGITAVNFWAAGTVAGITADAPCSVLLRRDRGTLTVAVADPTHLATSVGLRIDERGYHRSQADPTVRVTELEHVIALSVNVTDAHGATHTATFRH
jgi:hyaluronate lyase